MGGCVYCGFPAPPLEGRRFVRFGGLVCGAHSDLPPLDPAFGLAAELARSAYPALRLENRAASLERREPARAPP